MGPWRIAGIAAVIGGIVGLGLFAVWAVNLYVIQGGGWSLGWGPIETIMVAGFVWGPGLLISGVVLLAVDEVRATPSPAT